MQLRDNERCYELAVSREQRKVNERSRDTEMILETAAMRQVD